MMEMQTAERSSFAAICTLADVPPPPEPTLHAIIHKVCEVSRVRLTDIKSMQRGKHIVHARMIYYWVARKHTSKSSTQIGAVAGKDHSTILNGVSRVKREAWRYADDVAAIERALGVSG